jgi:hypothetical protein
MNASHSTNGAQRITLNQSGHDWPPLLSAQFVHASNMLERSSKSNEKLLKVTKKVLTKPLTSK